VTLDLAVLGFLAVSALLGAASGALKQLVSLAAVAAGVLAARAWAVEVGAGLARRLSPAARPLAPALLFLGTFALASLAGAALLRATGVARAVRGPADRGLGALVGGAKAAIVAWALLSALVLAGELAPDVVLRLARTSELAALARAHNLVARLHPGAARRIEELEERR
jgi:membrane protein required for colicin V production